MWWRTVLFICVTVATTGALGDDDSLLVRIESGEVRGYRDPEGDIFAFYGIPYATSPTGRNRFKAPLPAHVWLQTLDAVDKKIICPQAPMPPHELRNVTMQENCLIANVFVPNTDLKNLPVLIIVHGGGFQVGYGNWFTPKGLIRSKKMVVVTFNYRLGIHGFLCLGTNDVPGNAGMKDQVALLRWVNRNIAGFGGNPDDVTLLGHSAGSVSVDLLLLSKATRGLFNKVVAESGSHLSAFAVQRGPIEHAKDFAKRLNFNNLDDVFALEDFYTTLSFEQLTIDPFSNRTDGTFGFSPCVERDTGEEMFLDDDPFNIIKTGQYPKVPLLYGFANMEGLHRINYFEQFAPKMNKHFASFLTPDLQFRSEDERQSVAKTVKQFYFGEKPVSTENILSYIDYLTDVVFAYSTLRSVKLQVEGGHNSIYLYEYSFVDDNIPLVPHTNVRGADHCAQTMAVMDMNNIFDNDETHISDEYKKMKSVMREIWTNFITTGKPIPEVSKFPAWPPVGANRSPHMSLGKTVELKGSLLERRSRFWDEIYDKYYRPAIPPPAPTAKHSEL